MTTDLPYRPCVGIMLINHEWRVFVGQRIDQNVEAWQMPQGGIDKGENPRDAALRELAEETGIRSVGFVAEHPELIRYDLPPELVGKVWKGRYRGQEQKWYLLRFDGAESEISLDNEAPEFACWRWARLSELTPLAAPFKRAVYREVVAGFADHFPATAR